MTRISLKEAYDNKDVVAQIYAIRDIAEGAEDTANNAVSTANTASEHVDALVPQVEGAVQNANNASASAQQSATTVAGYDTRLTTAETKNDQQDTAISELQTANANNVKLRPAGEQHISGTLFIDALDMYGPQQFKLLGTQTDGWKHIGISDSQGDVTKIQMNRDETQLVGDKVYRNTVPSGADSRSIVNKAYVESTDGVTNNLVHRTANEKVDGIKEFAYNTDKHVGTHITSTSGYWVKLVKWTSVALRYNVVMTLISPYFRDANFYGKLMFGCWDMTNFEHLDLISPYNWANRFKVTYDGNEMALWYNNTSGEYKLGLNVFIDIELNGTDKSSRAILIPESEQVAENPDWTSFARVLDGTYKGWGA